METSTATEVEKGNALNSATESEKIESKNSSANVYSSYSLDLLYCSKSIVLGQSVEMVTTNDFRASGMSKIVLSSFSGDPLTHRE